MPQPIKFALIVGNHAGVLAILTVLSRGHKITGAIAYTDDVRNVLKDYGIVVFDSIKSAGFEECLKKSSVLMSVHGREIVPNRLISSTKLGAFNVHPYLYLYKGARPVNRALADRQWHASVGAHYMTEKVDEGKVVTEEFLDIAPANSVEEIYNRIYPLYASVILKTIQFLEKQP